MARPTFAAPVGPAAAAAGLQGEQRRRAAQLLRAAALAADNGLQAAELVELGRQCVLADLRDWRYRELLGAGLYRAGNHGEAVRELDEAMRLHGTGSLWARLFLALAHQRLGHSDWVRQLREQMQDATTWEEQVIQTHLLGELDAVQTR
jgi:hypothetical protein